MLQALFIGVVSGLISALSVSLLFFVFLRPQLGLSDKIAKVRSASYPGTHFYQFRIANKRHLAGLIDLRISVRLVCNGIGAGGEKTSYWLTVGTPELVYFGATSFREEKNFRVTITYRSQSSRDALSKASLIESTGVFPTDRKFELEQLLFNDQCYLEVALIATDSLSGVRRFFSQRYEKSDIKEGRFAKRGFRIIEYAGGQGLRLMGFKGSTPEGDEMTINPV